MKYYEIENNKLVERLINKDALVHGIKNKNLLVEELDEKNYFINNTFLNKALVVPKAMWDNQDGIPVELSNDVQVYNSTFYDMFQKQVEDNTIVPVTSFILAITYACNLKCTYCYQQNNPHLNRSVINEDMLERVLFIIEQYHNNHPNETIEIGIFGGEPLLPITKNAICKIFRFCAKFLFGVHIITNGTYLKDYLKEIVIYRGIVRSINTTIDSIDCNEQTRAYLSTSICDAPNDSASILKSAMTLLYYGVPVDISTNVDRHNLHQLNKICEFLSICGFFDFYQFHWGIGRVDDRMYETEYADIIDEVDILKELNKMNFIPDNLHAAFLKSGYNLCKKINRTYNQSELRGAYNYCWASSKLDKVFYVDNELNTYRCTYTVGRAEKSIFQFSLENIESYKLSSRNYLNVGNCKNCIIGGCCSGGCMLSYDEDKDRQCKYELSLYTKFIKDFFLPIVRELLMEISV